MVRKHFEVHEQQVSERQREPDVSTQCGCRTQDYYPDPDPDPHTEPDSATCAGGVEVLVRMLRSRQLAATAHNVPLAVAQSRHFAPDRLTDAGFVDALVLNTWIVTMARSAPV